jgi:hypothetical protein
MSSQVRKSLPSLDFFRLGRSSLHGSLCHLCSILGVVIDGCAINAVHRVTNEHLDVASLPPLISFPWNTTYAQNAVLRYFRQRVPCLQTLKARKNRMTAMTAMTAKNARGERHLECGSLCAESGKRVSMRSPAGRPALIPLYPSGGQVQRSARCVAIAADCDGDDTQPCQCYHRS